MTYTTGTTTLIAPNDRATRTLIDAGFDIPREVEPSAEQLKAWLAERDAEVASLRAAEEDLASDLRKVDDRIETLENRLRSAQQSCRALRLMHDALKAENVELGEQLRRAEDQIAGRARAAGLGSVCR